MLDALPDLERASVNRYIPGFLRISVSTYRRILNADIDSRQEVSATNLLRLAGLFGCEPQELFTQPPES